MELLQLQAPEAQDVCGGICVAFEEVTIQRSNC